MLKNIKLLYSLVAFILTLSTCYCEDSDITKFMKHFKVIPDVIPEGPKDFLQIKYDSQVQADKGVELTPTQVKNQPINIEWSSNKYSFYTLILTDPDAKNPNEPESSEFIHWLVGNIPGNNINNGDVLVEYVGSGPPKRTGLHRYVFLLYKQTKKLIFDEIPIAKTDGMHRLMYSTQKFAEKYNLGIPIAGNFYQAEYDDYVPTVHKQLGFDLMML